MKNMRWLAMLLALVMVAAACGSDAPADTAEGDASVEDDSGDEAVEATQGGDLTFYMITHSDDGPFWTVVKNGAEAAAADVGVNLEWKPGINDAATMVTDIEAAITAGADGIAASLPDPDALSGPLSDAVAAGIPVYTLNSGVNQYKEIGATSHVGQTEFIAGQGAGERFNAAGATHVLCAFQEDANIGLTERCDGLKDTFSGTTTIAFGGLDADGTQADTIQGLLSDESIDAIMGTGPVIAVAAYNASEAVGRGATIGGFDITPEIIDLIEAGSIAFTVDQQQYLQGYLPVILMYLEATNQNTAGGGLPILTGPGFVTPENAEAVKALVAQQTR